MVTCRYLSCRGELVPKSRIAYTEHGIRLGESRKMQGVVPSAIGAVLTAVGVYLLILTAGFWYFWVFVACGAAYLMWGVYLLSSVQWVELSERSANVLWERRSIFGRSQTCVEGSQCVVLTAEVDIALAPGVRLGGGRMWYVVLKGRKRSIVMLAARHEAEAADLSDVVERAVGASTQRVRIRWYQRAAAVLLVAGVPTVFWSASALDNR